MTPRSRSARMPIGACSMPIAATLMLALVVAMARPAPTWAQSSVLSGSYTGNATDNRAITDVGFQPSVVIVKANATQIGVIRTSTMSGDNAKPMTGSTALTANLIQSLDATGFTIGNDNRVNANGTVYHWVAFTAAAGEMHVSSYVGTGVDNAAVTGVGFNPDLLFIMSASTHEAVLRPNTSSSTFNFANGAGFVGVGSHNADGFQLRTDTRVNTNGVTYHYIAWDAVTGRQKFNSYIGDGADNRDITGLGFRPEYVIVRDITAANDTMQHPASVGSSVDSSLFFGATAGVTNRIQALQSDGFQVGTDNDVNKTGGSEFYAYFAWAGTYTIYGMATWRESTKTTPEYAAWIGTGFRTPEYSASVGEWRTMQAAESPSRTEIIVAGLDANGDINGEMWNGSTWSALSINPLTTTASETYWWSCDVAYEGLSGDALLIWDNNTAGNLLQYSTWNGTSWSAKTTIAAYTGAEPQHLHLAADPNSDEMVVVISDLNADHRTLVWSGSSWGNQVTLDTSGTVEADQTAIAVAYEQQSGRAMALYAKAADAKVYYRIWDGAAWGTEASVDPGLVTSTQPSWLVAAGDPTSNNIALGVQTANGSGNDTWLSVWNGSSWSTPIGAIAQATGYTYPNVAVAFESTTGQALAAYGSGTDTTVHYRTWNGSWSADQTGPTLGSIPNSMTLAPDPGSDDIMLSVQDANSDLHYVLWNGASWN